MSWNYRVMRHIDGTLAIHEAYYDEDKETPHSWTEEPVHVVGDDLEGLMSTMNMMNRALIRPVLDLATLQTSTDGGSK